MKNLTITKKLLLTFMVIIVLYIATLATSLFGVSKITSYFDEFYNHSYQTVKESMDFRLNQYTVARDILYIVTEQDPIATSEELQEAKASMKIVDQAMVNLKKLNPDDELIIELQQMYDKIAEPRDELMRLIENQEYDLALNAYQKEYSPRATEARNFLKGFEDSIKLQADSYFEMGKDSASNMYLSAIVLSVITLLFILIIWYLIVRSITLPVQELKRVAKELAQGKLGTAIQYQSADELGELSDSMRETMANLRASIMQIANSAEQVSGGAQQISNGAQILSQGASEQAGSIEELAASINDISENVKQNADDTVAACALADTVEKEIISSSQQMEEVTKAINEIKVTSSDITGIVKEIEDIAFQTNLLSLNAAVEAARAGESGRGFTVVATEIRKLSEKTTEASKTTASLIQNSTKSVEKGSTLILKTEQSLHQVVDGAREVANKVENISQSNIQQANFINQIRQSIGQISDIVQGNSATSEESAAASEELAAQAQLLRELVARFDLQGSGTDL